MSKHTCDCQTEYEQLQRKHKSLVVDYHNLVKKNQLLRNTQATYELRNQELARQAMKRQVAVKQLECELDQVKVSMGHKPESIDLYESEKYRRDVNRNQDLNYLIDAKNKDITFMKQQLRPVAELNQQNQQLRARNFQLQDILRKNQTQLKMERQNNFWKEQYHKIINQSMNTSIITALQPQRQRNSSNMIVNRQEVRPVSSNAVVFQKPNVNATIGPTIVNSVCQKIKEGQELRSTQNTYSVRNNNSDFIIANVSPRNKRTSSIENKNRKQASTQDDWKTQSQLNLIQSRIEMLQKENNSLRGQLMSKIY